MLVQRKGETDLAEQPGVLVGVEFLVGEILHFVERGVAGIELETVHAVGGLQSREFRQ